MTINAQLVEAMMVDCIMLDQKYIPDGQGGFLGSGWTEGAPFKASIEKNKTFEAILAEQEDDFTAYLVTVPRSVKLEYHDVFMRVKDGKVFRVTGDTVDGETPEVATFQFAQVTAERWRLT